MPDYVMDAKGEDWITTFVDPGPPFDPSIGPGDAFFRGILEESPDLVVAFGHDGTISYANDACRVLLGRDPGELIGTNALDLVAPEDLENAAGTVRHAAEVEGWRPARPLRLVHADGRHITFEVAGLSLFHVPTVGAIVIVGRWADDHARVDRALGLLAGHRPVGDVLAELVHLLHRPGWRLAVAVQYDDGAGSFAAAASGADAALVALDVLDDGPWATARATGEAVVDIGLATVPAPVRAAAEAAGFTTCWAIPIDDPAGARACLIVWNAEAIEPELGQDLLLRRLLSLVGLALDGRAHAASLERAARCDPLTGLWNRRHLESVAAACPGTVALLLCDLDGFKQVNDDLGHPAGDAVIRAVADRLREAVRDSDLVARFGGDEFAILCPGVQDLAQVQVLAARIVASVCRPIAYASSAVRVGVSLGGAIVAPGSAWTLDDLVRDADGRLLTAKAEGKATFRIGTFDPRPAVSGSAPNT